MLISSPIQNVDITTHSKCCILVEMGDLIRREKTYQLICFSSLYGNSIKMALCFSACQNSEPLQTVLNWIRAFGACQSVPNYLDILLNLPVSWASPLYLFPNSNFLNFLYCLKPTILYHSSAFFSSVWVQSFIFEI